jgi:hypothetical protein
MKHYPPDSNYGDHSLEVRLRDVLQVYRILKGARLREHESCLASAGFVVQG